MILFLTVYIFSLILNTYSERQVIKSNIYCMYPFNFSFEIAKQWSVSIHSICQTFHQCHLKSFGEPFNILK